MIPVCIQTLIVSPLPAPSILVLCPESDYGKEETCRIVPIMMGVPEATQIGVALEGSKLKRPMTHDLFLDALTNLDTTVDRVEIYDVDGKVFFARLVLRTENRIIELDARPSDAISLAIRQNAPVYMTEEVLRKASYPFIFNKGADPQKEMEEFHAFVQNLAPNDFLD